MYAMPQKSKKNKGKEEEVEAGREEDKAVFHSFPDKKTGEVSVEGLRKP